MIRRCRTGSPLLLSLPEISVKPDRLRILILCNHKFIRGEVVAKNMAHWTIKYCVSPK